MLKRLEMNARKAKKGLWADPQPMPPWEVAAETLELLDGLAQRYCTTDALFCCRSFDFERVIIVSVSSVFSQAITINTYSTPLIVGGVPIQIPHCFVLSRLTRIGTVYLPFIYEFPQRSVVGGIICSANS